MILEDFAGILYIFSGDCPFFPVLIYIARLWEIYCVKRTDSNVVRRTEIRH